MVLFQTSNFANEYRSKEALTHGYKSTLRRPVFVSFPLTTDQTSGHTGYYTTKHQMKDTNIDFPLMLLSFLKVEGSGYYSLTKWSIFSKFSKILETDSSEPQLLGNFFQMAVIQRQIEILT